jgi:hypothetical protein
MSSFLMSDEALSGLAWLACNVATPDVRGIGPITFDQNHAAWEAPRVECWPGREPEVARALWLANLAGCCLVKTGDDRVIRHVNCDDTAEQLVRWAGQWSTSGRDATRFAYAPAGFDQWTPQLWARLLSQFAYQAESYPGWDRSLGRGIVDTTRDALINWVFAAAGWPLCDWIGTPELMQRSLGHSPDQVVQLLAPRPALSANVSHSPVKAPITWEQSC